MKNRNKTNKVLDNIADTQIAKFDLTLIANFFKSLNQQGPGGTEETLKALGFVTNLPPKAKIADIGCGTGRQTSVLASNLDCTITAIDFLPEMVEGLNDRLKRENLEQKVTAIRASMDKLPFQPNKLRIMERAGYSPVAHFILPEYCWAQNFHAPLHIRMQEFLKENDNSEAAKLFVGLLKEEMSIYQQYKSYFGYVFYIGQKID